MLRPEYAYEVVGEAEVLKLFAYNQGKDTVAGCRVHAGVLHRTTGAAASLNSSSSTGDSASNVLRTRVLRNGVKVYEGPMKAVYNSHHHHELILTPLLILLYHMFLYLFKFY